MKRGSYESEGPPKRNKFIGRTIWQPREPAGDDDDLHHKPVLLSQVVSAVRESKSRDEALEEQPPDEKSKARNRRMFGIIMGTLEKFQSEESKRKKTTARRVQIEEKLERLAEKERDVIRKEKKELHKKRREERAQLRRSELRMERVQVHEEWEKSHKTLINFIQTKTKPHLFYLPKEHTEESEKRLKQTKDKYRFILAEKRAKVQKELSEIDEMYKKETEMDEPEDTNKLMETDSHENTNNDTIEPMEESIDHKSDSPSHGGNENSRDNERERINDDDNELQSNQRNRNKTSKFNKKDDDDEEEGDDTNNKRRNDRIGNEIDKNHQIDSINIHSNDENGNHVDSSIDNQPIGADESEQLAEKEFEPIYDDDE